MSTRIDAWLWAVPLFIAVAHLPLWIEHRFSVPAQPFVWGLAVLGAWPLRVPDRRDDVERQGLRFR